MIYEKLVRDEVPSLIFDKKFSIRKPSSKEELLELIKKKVQEELEEFYAAPSVDEAADVLEIIWKLFGETLLHGSYRLSREMILSHQARKQRAKGSFDKDIILVEVED